MTAMFDSPYEESYPPSVLGIGPNPVAGSLNPASVVVDVVTPVTVTGTGFTAGTRVVVDGVAQETTFISATQVRYQAQADEVGAQDVRVRTEFGQVSNALSLAVTASGTGELNLPDDPGGYTIDQITAWVDAHPELADEVLVAEQARGSSARVTLVDWLQGYISDRDAGTVGPS